MRKEAVTAAFAQFAFVRVLFVASLIAIALQCLVYPIRHLLGLRAARIVLRGSLVGFVAVGVVALFSASRSGDFDAVIGIMGWTPLIDFGVFILPTMFISYFMGDRYLAEQAEREERRLPVQAEERVGEPTQTRQGV